VIFRPRRISLWLRRYVDFTDSCLIRVIREIRGYICFDVLSVLVAKRERSEDER
jgi:hypothetical protein